MLVIKYELTFTERNKNFATLILLAKSGLEMVLWIKKKILNILIVMALCILALAVLKVQNTIEKL